MRSLLTLLLPFRPCRAFFYTFFAVLLVPALVYAGPSFFTFDTSRDYKAFMIGYGQSIPGWGLTTQRVETVDLIPRYNHVIFHDLGSGLLKGDYSTIVELPVSVIYRPVVSSMMGINFLACYTFTSNKDWRPYIFGGGGPVYSFADIKGMSAKLNGNYQFAMGLEHPINSSQSILTEIRYHHISNGGRKDPNVPLNSLKFVVGLTF